MEHTSIKDYIKESPATSFFILLILLVQGATYIFGNGPTDYITVRNFGAIQTGDSTFSELPRLMTYIFPQIGGMIHLLCNVAVIIICGPLLESIYESAKFTMLFIVTGIFGGIFILIFSENVVAAGASGSTFGMLGVYLALIIKRHSKIDIHTQKTIIVMFVVNMIYTFVAPNVSIAAHLGGVISGILLGLLTSSGNNNYKRLNFIKSLGQSFVVLFISFVLLNVPKYLVGEEKLNLSLDTSIISRLSENKSESNNDFKFLSKSTSTEKLLDEITWSVAQYNDTILPTYNKVTEAYNNGIASNDTSNYISILLDTKLILNEAISELNAHVGIEETSELNALLMEIYLSLSDSLTYAQLTLESSNQEYGYKFINILNETNQLLNSYSDNVINFYDTYGFEYDDN